MFNGKHILLLCVCSRHLKQKLRNFAVVVVVFGILVIFLACSFTMEKAPSAIESLSVNGFSIFVALFTTFVMQKDSKIIF